MKDNFSQNAADYARYRPGYPETLIRFIVDHSPAHQCAWDCATGSGQLAVLLAPYYKTVFATDMSMQQLAHAPVKENINYKCIAAERRFFQEEQFDVITVAQAIHWFDFEAFYEEARRTLRPRGLVAVCGYSLPHFNSPVDEVLQYLYKDILGAYWDPERRYIDESYNTIPFPFDEIPAPPMMQRYMWNIEEFKGYLNTWSAVKHYKDKMGTSPLDAIDDLLDKCWDAHTVQLVTFPLLLRAGRKAVY